MVSISEADWELRHPKIVVSATGTFPITTELTEWIEWADGLIITYLQTGNTLPTDVGDIIKNVADDLLIRKYTYEKLVGHVHPLDLLRIPLPILTGANKAQLDSLKGQSPSIEEPAFNFDLGRTEGGFD